MRWSEDVREPQATRWSIATAAERLELGRRPMITAMQRDIDATHAALQMVPDLDAVIDEECRYDGITLIDLLVRNERGQLLRRYADARTAICVRATELGMSTTQTARAIGMRSHTSVIGSRRR